MRFYHLKLRWWVILLCASQTVAGLWAQRYPFRNYSTGDGLPLGPVTAIHQDTLGFMWFGTPNGASRFDGVGFTPLTTQDGLLNNTIRFIKEDRGGALWIGTEQGLSRWVGGKLTHYTTKEGLVHDQVNMMYQDKAGALWFATKGGISQLAGEQFTNYTARNGLPDADIRVILEDRQGHLLAIGRTGGVRQLAGDTFALVPTGLAALSVQGALADGQGNLWVATSNGLLKVGADTVTPYTTASGLGSNRLNCIFIDVKGVLWAGTDGGGLSKQIGSQFINFTTRNGLANNRIYTIMQDAEGNIWVGTDAGATRLPGDWFANYTTDYGLIDNNVWAVHEDKSGNVWVGTASGLSRLTRGRFTNYTTADGLPDNRVRAVLEDRSGGVWVGTDAGLARLQRGRWVRYTTADGLAGDRIRALLEDREGHLWIGTYDQGISRWSEETFTNYTVQNGLPNNSVRALTQDRAGAIWIATDGAGLVRFSGGKFTAYTTANGLRSNRITCVADDQHGNLWVGTDGSGVSKMAQGQFTHLTAGNGLSHDTIYFALEDAKGDMWFGTGRGVDRVTGTRIKNYTTADGLAGNTVNPNAVMRDQFGTLWFGTIFGLSQYNPEQSLDLTTPPPVYITRLQVAHKDQALAPNLRLSAGDNYLAFHFSGLSYRSQDRIRYQYILEGLDKNWSELTPLRSVQYTGLEPGSYIFRVRAQNMDGVLSAQPANFAFSIAPPFWQTWWFIALALIAAGAVLYRLQQRYARRFELRRWELDRLVAQKTESVHKHWQETQEQLKDLEAAHRAATLPVDTADREKLLQQLIGYVGAEFGPAVNAYILLLDKEGQHLQVRARHGEAQAEDRTDHVAVNGVGLTAYAARTGVAVNLADVNSDPRYLRGWKAAVSELAVPLKVGNRVIGVIDLQSPAYGAFSATAAAFITSLAERAALAITAAELSEGAQRAYDQLQEAQTRLVKAERLAALSQLGIAIQQEIHSPLATLMEQAEQTLNPSHNASPDIQRQVQIIHDMGKRMREILQDWEKVQDNAATYIGQTLMNESAATSGTGPDLEVEDISIARLRSRDKK